MARWGNNPANIETRTLYPNTEEPCEAKVISVDVIQGQIKDDGTQSLAVRVKMEFTTGDYVGKKIDGLLWLHTEESEKISKQAQMAVYGFERNNESGFNEFAADLDWLVDGDTKELGTAWTNMMGRVVLLRLDVKPNKQSGELQQQIGWLPII